ncbi:MAG TPA: PEGA domain-containing protein [Methanocorpusculum sp.]|nr:PEGA domain-containing protein [Methanocorpusculum sp.]
MNALPRVLIGIFAVVCLTACIAGPVSAGTITLTSKVIVDQTNLEYTQCVASYTLTQIGGAESRVGSTPDTFDMPAGSYHVVIQYSGYTDDERDLTIGGDNTHLSYEGKFTTPVTTPTMVTLNVYTCLNNAVTQGSIPIYIDDALVGYTSSSGTLSVSVLPGEHTIKGIYGEQEVIQGLTLTSGEMVTTLSFQSLNGKIDVTSNPSAASVSIDGHSVGYTPCTISVAPGEHTVSVSLADYATMSTTVTVADGTTEYLNFPLSKAQLCSVVISSTPAGDVYFDGEYRGCETLIVTSGVKAGIHKVRIEKEGYEAYYTEMEVVSGESNKLTVNLKPCEEGYVEEVPLGRTGLSVYCTDATATVLLDKKSLGKTPVVNYTDKDLAAGEHTLVLKVGGVAVITTKIILEAGEIMDFTYTINNEAPTAEPTPVVTITETPTQPTIAPTAVETVVVPTETPASPAPLLGILAGLGVCALVLRRR